MQILQEEDKIRRKAEADVENHGDFPDHNLYYLLYDEQPEDYKPAYFDFGKDGGSFTFCKGHIWRIPFPPALSKEKETSCLEEMMKYLTGREDIRKIMLLDCKKETRKKLLEMAPGFGWKASAPSFVSWWPVFDLSKFDEKLEGKKWRKLRKTKNYFLKHYKVEKIDSSKADKKELEDLILRWKSQKEKEDKEEEKENMECEPYLRFIKSGFPGCQISKVLLVNGKAAAVFAGWKIPNSNTFYPHMSIKDYDYKGLGEYMSLEIFSEAKKAGFEKLDFGGSDKELLIFKKRFHPESIYKAYNFTMVKNK